MIVVLGLVSLSGAAWAGVATLADPSGEVVAWGRNFHGQTIVPSAEYLTAAAGGAFNLGIHTDGTLAAWGDNAYGQTTVPSGLFTSVAAGGTLPGPEERWHPRWLG